VEGKGRLESYDSFCESQMQFLKRPRVIDAAMHSDTWQKTGRGITDAATQAFINHLQITRQGELILVAKTDRDPTVANAGVDAILHAYNALYIEDEIEAREAKLEQLRRLERQRTLDYDSLQQRIRAVAAPFGGLENLDWLYQTSVGEYRKRLIS